MPCIPPADCGSEDGDRDRLTLLLWRGSRPEGETAEARKSPAVEAEEVTRSRESGRVVGPPDEVEGPVLPPTADWQLDQSFETGLMQLPLGPEPLPRHCRFGCAYTFDL